MAADASNLPAEDTPDRRGLAQPATVLRGVGPERGAQLERLGLRTVEDVLLYRPRRYEDRRRVGRILDLRLGEAAAVRGRIVAQGVKYWRRRTQSVFEFILDDGSGRLHCRWWNQPYLEGHFQTGQEVVVYGRPTALKPRAMDHPETEVVETGEESSIHHQRIVPVYPLTEGLPQRWLRSLIWRTLAEPLAEAEAPLPELPVEDLPAWRQAVHWLHFPETLEQADLARQRLALEEFVQLQLAMRRRRRQFLAHAQALPCAGDNRFIRPFLRQLGFQLTPSQTRVLRELRQDLGAARPMRRLLQGDVGSGKTVVAACCALMTLESGFSVALMAPTEILAEQHHQLFARWFQPLGLATGLLTASRKTTPGESAGRGSSSAIPPSLWIGTHALLEETFAPENLGLVIIDEQHKFGVAQRQQLVRKGRQPHLLVMTATPIPRTLGLTLYADFDLAVIDTPPAGRGTVRTFLRAPAQMPRVLAFIRQQVQSGRQAYLVYPRVEEGDSASGTKAVTREYERLRDSLPPCRLGLLHGRLPAAEKEAVMAAFRANQVQVLVTTSVVEVGLDVPNATVMVVENADHFGLAQLHQLRGRVGRGPYPSYCILVGAARTPEARARLRVMAQTHDGFRLAEEDLRLRGPGELLGHQQSGLPSFRFGDLATDLGLVQRARRLVEQMP